MTVEDPLGASVVLSSNKCAFRHAINGSDFLNVVVVGVVVVVVVVVTLDIVAVAVSVSWRTLSGAFSVVNEESLNGRPTLKLTSLSLKVIN